jgi:hypothetical protein
MLIEILEVTEPSEGDANLPSQFFPGCGDTTVSFRVLNETPTEQDVSDAIRWGTEDGAGLSYYDPPTRTGEYKVVDSSSSFAPGEVVVATDWAAYDRKWRVRLEILELLQPTEQNASSAYKNSCDPLPQFIGNESTIVFFRVVDDNNPSLDEIARAISRIEPDLHDAALRCYDRSTRQGKYVVRGSPSWFCVGALVWADTAPYDPYETGEFDEPESPRRLLGLKSGEIVEIAASWLNHRWGKFSKLSGLTTRTPHSRWPEAGADSAHKGGFLLQLFLLYKGYFRKRG